MNIKKSRENLRKRERRDSEGTEYFPDEIRFRQAMDIKVGHTRDRKQRDILETGYD